ncbi:hypothetical protein B0H13DRAFT_2554386 [Mycena leptocephala]|nr:hypothetical protein B0H13DRAFT_2554386 [Mycena leptocephala]
MQVAQLEKETKELNERLRIVAKGVDHIERAYHKEERPLLAWDYDHLTVRKEAPRVGHEEYPETKKRLVRMMPDYEARPTVILVKKGEEYAKDAASGKIEEKKTKWRESRRSADSKRKKTAPTHRLVSARQRKPPATANTTVIACSTWGLARNLCYHEDSLPEVTVEVVLEASPPIIVPDYTAFMRADMIGVGRTGAGMGWGILER